MDLKSGIRGGVFAALSLVAALTRAVELPEGFKVGKDGVLSFPGGSVGVWVAQVGWTGAVRFVPAEPVERNGRIVVAGDCNLSSVKGRYEYRFKPTSKTVLESAWAYRMAAPIDTAVSCAAISVNHADVKGVFLDGVYRPIPLAAGKEYTFHPKELAFVLEGGRTLKVRHSNVHYIDNRRFGNDSSGFRLLMDRSGGRVTDNRLKVAFELGEVPQTAAALPDGADFPLDGIVPPGRLVNGGVGFAVGTQAVVLEKEPIRLNLPAQTLGVSLLHATDGTLEEGETVGRLTFVLADGSERTRDVVYGVDVSSREGLHDLRNAKPAHQKWNIVRFDGVYASHFAVPAGAVAARLTPVKGRWLVAAATYTEAPVSFKAYSDKPVTIAEGPEWSPIEFTGSPVKDSALDFSNFAGNGAAGREGSVQVTPDGAFRLAGSGRRIRFNGANICGSPLVAEAAEVEEMVRRMKACGLNAIRFHHAEVQFVNAQAKSGLDFDPDLMDRFLRTWAICATNGLYITYDVYCSRSVYPGEIAGVEKKHGLAEYKALLPISQAYQENLKAFCRRVLTQVNPYTGVRLADDPAVMGVNVVNEDDLGFYWLSARPAWEVAYAEHRRTNPALDPNPGPSNPDFQRFLYERQAAFHREMIAFLRDEIGIKAPLTSMNMSDRFELTPISANFDWVDKHCYYSHPNKLDPKQSALVPNAYSQTGSPVESFASPAPRQIAFSRYVGKPMGSTEYNFCYPNPYRHEGVPLFMAYAAHQDWNAFFRFMWSCGAWSFNKTFRAVPFEETSDPIMQLSDRVAAALFLRGDLKPAAHGYAVAVTPDGRTNLPSDGVAYLETVARVGSTITPDALPAGWRVYTGPASLDPADAAALKRAREQHRAVTPDGQIDLDAESHALRIVTPRTEVLALARGALTGASLAVTSAKGCQTLAAISLDERPLVESGRILLVHMPDIQNSGVIFNNELKSVQMNWGELPYLVQRVKASVALKVTRPLRVTALTGDGRALGDVPTRFADGVLSFDVEPAAFPAGALAYELSSEFGR